MASNDVRRLDDTSPWWIFLWAGPLELAVMLAAVSLRISLLAALAGAGCLLLLFPLQVNSLPACAYRCCSSLGIQVQLKSIAECALLGRGLIRAVSKTSSPRGSHLQIFKPDNVATALSYCQSIGIPCDDRTRAIVDNSSFIVSGSITAQYSIVWFSFWGATT